MRRASSLVLILALCGCTMDMSTVNARVQRAAAAQRPSAVEATPTPTPQAPTPAPTATPAPVLTTTLTGVARISPTYLIAAGGGNIIGHAGSNLISAGIIGQSGSNIIGQSGSNIIGQSGSNYALLSAEEDLLPVQGMHVEARSALTDERVAGPVVTDETGSYTLAVPADLVGNVVVKAYIPKLESDPRLQYQLLVDPAKAQAPVLDEDSSLAAKLVLDAVASRLERGMTQPVEENLTFFPPLFREVVRPIFETLHREGQAAGIAEMSPEVRKQVALDAARVLIALGNIHGAKNVFVPTSTVLDSIADAFKGIRLALQAKLKNYPDFKQADSNPMKRPIEKETDIGAYIVDMVRESDTHDELLGEVGHALIVLEVKDDAINALFGAYVGLLLENNRTIQNNPEALKAIRAALKKGGAAGAEAVASDATATP